MSAACAPWPTDLVFDRAAKLLRIAFDDGATFDIPFELLRVESPSAENKGHGGATAAAGDRQSQCRRRGPNRSAATPCASSSTTATIPGSIPGTCSTNSAATATRFALYRQASEP